MSCAPQKKMYHDPVGGFHEEERVLSDRLSALVLKIKYTKKIEDKIYK
jgi:hypothetical protein